MWDWDNIKYFQRGRAQLVNSNPMNVKTQDTRLRKYNISIVLVILFAILMILGVWWYYNKKVQHIEQQETTIFR